MYKRLNSHSKCENLRWITVSSCPRSDAQYSRPQLPFRRLLYRNIQSSTSSKINLKHQPIKENLLDEICEASFSISNILASIRSVHNFHFVLLFLQKKNLKKDEKSRKKSQRKKTRILLHIKKVFFIFVPSIRTRNV